MKRIFSVLPLLLLSGCGDLPPPIFEDAGYYKAPNLDRVFTVNYSAQATVEEMKRYGSEAMRTDKRRTFVFFYPPGRRAPNDRLTLANNLVQALAIARDGHHYAYWHGHTGEVFIDCKKEPGHSLCGG